MREPDGRRPLNTTNNIEQELSFLRLASALASERNEQRMVQR